MLSQPGWTFSGCRICHILPVNTASVSTTYALYCTIQQKILLIKVHLFLVILDDVCSAAVRHLPHTRKSSVLSDHHITTMVLKITKKVAIPPKCTLSLTSVEFEKYWSHCDEDKRREVASCDINDIMKQLRDRHKHRCNCRDCIRNKVSFTLL